MYFVILNNSLIFQRGEISFIISSTFGRPSLHSYCGLNLSVLQFTINYRVNKNNKLINLKVKIWNKSYNCQLIQYNFCPGILVGQQRSCSFMVTRTILDQRLFGQQQCEISNARCNHSANQISSGGNIWF